MQRQVLSGKNVLVIGLGLSGRSAAWFLLAHGALVRAVDRNAALLESDAEIQSFKQLGLALQSEEACVSLNGIDMVVLSPGVPSVHPLVEAARQAGIPVIGEIELGCRISENPILGITGTNGKTTVTLLVTHVLKECGQNACALGNVGTPFTQELLKISPRETIVLELSSYQLETLYQKSLESSLLLNITPDHLDRYKTMEAYAAAKCCMERCLKPHAPLYVEESTWQTYGYLFKEIQPRRYGYSPSSFIWTDLKTVFREEKAVFELPLELQAKRSHELENLMAAYALCADRGISGENFIKGWRNFKKPSHRIEFILEHRGVSFYDDSKGTNIDAVMRAVESVDRPIILIAGGVDKGASYTPWIELFKKKVKSICAIGQAAVMIEGQLSSSIPVTIFHSLEEAVHEAFQRAQKGDAILLSPGCSSFDMFRDYAHRGEEFQRIVRGLTD